MIIGITGTDGAGKGAVVDYLVKEKGFTHYSARTLITEEIELRGLEATRDNLRLVANDMRRAGGNDVIVKVALSKYANQSAPAVIESIRTMAEVETLKADGGILLAVDADQHLRYERITSRGSSTDQISFEEFQEQEEIEMNDPDPNGMQKAKVIEASDFTILNEGTIEELGQEIEKILEQIKNEN